MSDITKEQPPATDPKPDVCEWRSNGIEYQPQCGPSYMWVQAAHRLSVKKCRCGKTIRFVEAKKS